MPRLAWWLLLPPMIGSCGGSVSSSESGAPDASVAPDAAAMDAQHQDVPSTTDAPMNEVSVADAVAVDSGPTEFCEGAIKASRAGLIAEPAWVTSSLVVMDCCDGFVVRFHTEAQLGTDLTLTVQSYGLLPSGDHVLPTDAGGVSAEIAAAEHPGAGVPASGTLRLQIPPSFDEPTLASFCLEADDGNGPMKLFASNVAIAPWAWQYRLEVRLLADPNVTAQEASQLPLESLQLASGEPIIHLMSLAWYDASTHTGYWDSWYSSEWITNQLPPVGAYGLPFVVLADGERVYLGAFMSSFSSVGLSMPVVVLEDMQEGSFRIDSGYPGGEPPGVDPRDDPRVLSVLEEAQKLEP